MPVKKMHQFPNSAYPIGSKRNCSIAELKSGNCQSKRPVVAGRLLEWEEKNTGIFSGRLRDASGTCEFYLETGVVLKNADSRNPLNVGDILELTLAGGQPPFWALAVRRLVPTKIDWEKLPPSAVSWRRALFSEKQKRLLETRSRLIQQIRKFFLERGFLEIDAPTLVSYPGQEPHLEPFETIYRNSAAGARRLFLQTSPEFTMKKLLAAGFEKIFYLGHSFRDEPTSNLHQPEFFMLEWYRAYADYTALMSDCEALLRSLADFLYSDWKISFGGELLDFSQPFQRIAVREALEKFAAIRYDSVRTTEAFADTARAKGYTAVDDSWSWDDIFFEIFLNEIEPRLGKPVPTFLTEYPVSMGALARRMENNPEFVERFELYVAGIELANAFTELNDPEEQEARFLEDQAIRRKNGKEPFPIDPEFLDALRIGMPPAAGIALGVDRLLMVLLGETSIETLSFGNWHLP